MLKRYPNREIVILTDTMNSINKRRNQAMKKAQSGGGHGDIGDFEIS